MQWQREREGCKWDTNGERKSCHLHILSLRWVRLTSCQPGQLILCGTKNRRGRAFNFPSHLPLSASLQYTEFEIKFDIKVAVGEGCVTVGAKCQLCTRSLWREVQPSVPWRLLLRARAKMRWRTKLKPHAVDFFQEEIWSAGCESVGITSIAKG